jgi:hypothetical protein
MIQVHVGFLNGYISTLSMKHVLTVIFQGDLSNLFMYSLITSVAADDCVEVAKCLAI